MTLVLDFDRITTSKKTFYFRYLIDVHTGKTPFQIACKEGQFDVVELMVKNKNGFGINLNVQHANGMTPFNLTVNVRLLDTT